ncbi:MAG: hypothetical protein ABIJ21_06495 [Nanoarchaeota archaeon]
MPRTTSIYRVSEQQGISLSEIHSYALDLGYDIDDTLTKEQIEAILTQAGYFTETIIKESKRKAREEPVEKKEEPLEELLEVPSRISKKTRWQQRVYRQNILELGRTFSAPITTEEWDRFRRTAKRHGDVPSAREIISLFGPWYEYWRKVGYFSSPDNPSDNAVRDTIRNSISDGLEVSDISSRMRLRSSTVKKFVSDFGVLGKEYVRQAIKSIDTLVQMQLVGTKHWNGPYKRLAREELNKAIERHLPGAKDLSYVGLPSANFIDYIKITKNFQVDSCQSLAAEIDPKVADYMHSIIIHCDEISGGEIFKRLRLHHGPILDALKTYYDMRFNLAFLDYVGGWCEERKETLTELITHHLKDEAVVFVTLNDAIRERIRVAQGRGGTTPAYQTDDQYALCRELVAKLSDAHGYEMTEIFPKDGLPYMDDTEMLLVGFKLTKKRKQTTLEKILDGKHKGKILLVELHHHTQKKEHVINLYRIHPTYGNEKKLHAEHLPWNDQLRGPMLVSETETALHYLKDQGYEIRMRMTRQFSQYLKGFRRSKR